MPVRVQLHIFPHSIQEFRRRIEQLSNLIAWIQMDTCYPIINLLYKTKYSFNMGKSPLIINHTITKLKETFLKMHLSHKSQSKLRSLKILRNNPNLEVVLLIKVLSN